MQARVAVLHQIPNLGVAGSSPAGRASFHYSLTMPQTLLGSNPERPIRSAEEDKLQRRVFVERLTAALINAETRLASGVVVGLTGPWGSGKSSILNMVHEHISENFHEALVVRFDPWLVSNGSAIIHEFLSELLGTINQNLQVKEQLSNFANHVAKYGEYLAPFADLITPGVGIIAKSGSKMVASVLNREESLHSLRRKIFDDLEQIDRPIVVLIDELDRVEDEEIRAIAQLVRAVMDFPRISYLLAYDYERVVQALGGTGNDQAGLERGRLYLEKIVQYQISIPISLPQEINALLNAELAPLAEQQLIPEGWQVIERFQSLLEIVLPDLIAAPRDIRRLVGTFHVLASMIGREVDWLDLLGFSILQVKAPGTIARVKANPERVVGDPLSARVSLARMSDEDRSVEDRIRKFVPEAERGDAISNLLGYLFPYFSGDFRGTEAATDAIRYRRQLLTVLRLGLLPGSFSRSDIEKFLALSHPNMCGRLWEMYNDDTLSNFLDRLDNLYAEVARGRDGAFWTAVSDFLRKPDDRWISQYSPMHEIGRGFADLFKRQIRLSDDFRSRAPTLFDELMAREEVTLVSYLIRAHIFSHGLFERDERGSEGAFLDKERTQEIAISLSRRWRERHLAEPRWLGTLWDLQPVFTMLSTDYWDDPCRQRVGDFLEDDGATEALTLMMFGAVYSTETHTVARIVDLERYVSRLHELIDDSSDLHETVRVSIGKALEQLNRAPDS